MATMIKVGNDVVSFLKQQHREIRKLFEQVVDAQGDERAEAFYTLRRLLAVHETAEEEVVHPAARKALPDGEAIIEARLEEEHDAKELLAELEQLAIDSQEFDTLIRQLQTSVLAHADAEEREEFQRIGVILDEPKLGRMRKAVEIAEAIAPTRPHAGIESALANMLAGPFAAMVDRTRDAISGKH